MLEYEFHWFDDLGEVIKTRLRFRDDVSALEFAIERSSDYAVGIFESGRHVAHVNKGNAPEDLTSGRPFKGALLR